MIRLDRGSYSEATETTSNPVAEPKEPPTKKRKVDTLATPNTM